MVESRDTNLRHRNLHNFLNLTGATAHAVGIPARADPCNEGGEFWENFHRCDLGPHMCGRHIPHVWLWVPHMRQNVFSTLKIDPFSSNLTPKLLSLSFLLTRLSAPNLLFLSTLPQNFYPRLDFI
ncbi:unnamed protein product [Camellia sinensis]